MSYEIPKYKINEWNADDSTIPKWPDQLQGCDELNKAIHDHLCEILEAQGYSESDVCMASVGMWGAINVTRDYFEKQSALTVNALRTVNLSKQLYFDQIEKEMKRELADKDKLFDDLVLLTNKGLAEKDAEIADLKSKMNHPTYVAMLDEVIKPYKTTIAEQSALLADCLTFLQTGGNAYAKREWANELTKKIKAATPSGEGET